MGIRSLRREPSSGRCQFKLWSACALSVRVCSRFSYHRPRGLHACTPALSLATRSYDSGCVPRGPLLRECFPPFLATTASCASPFASPGLRFHTRPVVLAAWTTHGWSRDLPDVTLANLSLDASSPTPAAPKVLAPVSSLWTSAFPELATGRRLATFRAATSARGRISGLQTFLYVKASSFACHPGRSHRCGSFMRCPCSRLRRRVTISAL